MESTITNSILITKVFWYSIGTLATFLLGIISLWIKSGHSTKKIEDRLTDFSVNNLTEHKKINKAIEKNAKIVKEVLEKKDISEQLEAIKTEAIRWSSEKLNNVIVLEADMLRDFFLTVRDRKFSKLEIQVIKAEFQIVYSKFKVDAEALIGQDFIEYYFESIHQQVINQYIKDLSYYKIGNLNNLNKAFLLRSLVFFRDSLENILVAWNSYEKGHKEDKKKEKCLKK